MNKRTTVLEKARLRLDAAAKDAQQQKHVEEMGEVIAQKIVDNDVYFYTDPSFDFLIIASLKNVKTIH